MRIVEVRKKNSKRKRNLTFDEVEQMLISFSALLLKEESVEEVFWSLAKNVISKLRFVDCVIYSVDQRSRTLIQRAAYGPKSPKRNVILKPVTISIGSGITGFVAASGIAERIADTRKDPRYIIDDEARLSEITIPIKHKDRVIGIIDCEHPERNYFTDQHLRILNAVAAICAIKISHLEAQESIRKKEATLLLARQQMAELKLRAIRAQMNPHFIFNALNAIQHFITANDKQNALRFLSAFSKLVRLYLRYADNDVIDLFQELDVIEQYLKLQRLRYEGTFDSSVNVRNHNGRDIRVPGLVTQLIIEEGIENLARNSVAGKMIIDVNVSEQSVEVVVDTKASSVGAKLTKRYENEYTNWKNHIRLLKRISKYKIETHEKTIRSENATHHIVRITLPCL